MILRSGNLLKEVNQYSVLNLIRKRGPLTRPEIVRITGLSRPTVEKIIDEFRSLGFIEELGKRSSAVKSGRKPVLISLNPSAKYIVGIDFECPDINIVITDLKSRKLAEKSRRLHENDSPDRILRFLKGDIDALIQQLGIGNDKLVGIGIGLPGILDYSSGVSVIIERLSHWENVPIRDIMYDHYKVPVFIENDVNMMAIAEKYLCEDEVLDNMIYVALRQGIGAGIFIDGALYHGTHGNSGFLGHTTISNRGKKCKCGKKDCLELYADEPQIVASAIAAMQGNSRSLIGRLSDNNKEMISLTTIGQAADAGDHVALQVLHDAGNFLGIGIANMIYLLDINKVIIGGSAVCAGDQFLESVRASLNDSLRSVFQQELSVRFSRINESTAALGATIIVLLDIFKAPEIVIKEHVLT